MSELVFLVEDDVEGGLTARALGEPIFTQAANHEELVRNVRDAVQCHFDSPQQMPRIIRLHSAATQEEVETQMNADEHR